MSTSTTPSVVSAATAQSIEWPDFLAVLAELTATRPGRRRALDLQPSRALDDLEVRRRRFEETRRLLSERRVVPSSEAPIDEILERLISDRPPVRGTELLDLVALLRASSEAISRIRQDSSECPELGDLVAGLADVRSWLERVTSQLDRRGEVRDDASPKLVELRSAIRSSRSRLYEQLGEYVGSHRDHLSEDTIPMRGGRLMVVLASGARGQAPGLVHGRSGTGKSFYFEPIEVVESNNTLQQAVEDDEAERRRIFNALLAEAREQVEDFRAHLDVLAELDLWQAGARFAELTGARAAQPSEAGDLQLRKGRHPLLMPELVDLRQAALGSAGHQGAVVPLDLTLSPDRRALVVTGPNAGGKTVALKTVGLLTLIAQCGLPVPAAEGTRLPILERLVATVGDEQDLLADRSTFSGRLLRLKEAWDHAGPRALILLDELGSGTDPEEGAALAIALLEGLLERGSLAVITTHLTPLAAAALDFEGAECAAMEFANDTGEPTFRLLPGPPGGSEALSLARRLGLDAQWLARAEARLGSDHRNLRGLLIEVERLRDELAEAKQEAEAAVADAEILRDRRAAEVESLKQERRTVGKVLKAELEAFRQETAKSLRAEVARMEKELAAGRKKTVAAEATRRLFEAAPEIEVEPEPEAEGPLAVGDRVRHRGLGWEGVLQSLDRGRAEVKANGKRLRCRDDELAPVAKTAVKAPVRRPSKVSRDLVSSKDTAAELNLIGQRVEPALDRLDEYLDRALLGSRGEVRIVHGHGSGRLRDAVREHLRGHPAVASHRRGDDNEGGNGATVVSLRGG